jgi:hypothetical protein
MAGAAWCQYRSSTVLTLIRVDAAFCGSVQQAMERLHFLPQNGFRVHGSG